MHILYNLGFLLAAWKWGDWDNWQKYYHTILFFIIGDLLNNFVNYERSFWIYQGTILPNHTTIALLIMLVAYPSTVLIYLGRFPKRGVIRKALWWGLWVFLYVFIEYLNLKYFDLISHDNGWTMGWSLSFNMFLFIILRIHQINPKIAWIISVIWIIFLWNMFDLSWSHLK